jgi:hypothetical protein
LIARVKMKRRSKITLAIAAITVIILAVGYDVTATRGVPPVTGNGPAAHTRSRAS